MTVPGLFDPAILTALNANLQAADQAVVEGPAAELADSGAAVVSADAVVTLPVDEQCFSGSEQKRIGLALRAGMPTQEIAYAVFRLRHGRSAAPASTAAPVMTPDLGGDPADLATHDAERLAAIYALIVPLAADYQSQLEREWNALAQLPFRAQFGATPQEYGQIRAIYVIAGYRDPLGTIFSGITTGKFLRIPVVAHREMLGRLLEVENRLVSQGVPLGEMAFDVGRDVGIFEPRRIAGSRVISNHALGLAIDIAPTRNPQISNKTVIEILNKITGMDFGSRLTELNYSVQQSLQGVARASGEDPGSALGELEKLAGELQHDMTGASATLQYWLETQLPREAGYQNRAAADQSAVESAQLALAKAKNAGDSAAIGAAEKALDAAVTKAAGDAVDYGSDVEVGQLQDLRKALGKDGDKTIEQWRRGGISNLPLCLVQALIGAGLGWGAEYEGTKDMMHFELSDTKGSPFIPPDSPPLKANSLFPGFPP